MAGAAITITVLTLAAVHTLNIPVDSADGAAAERGRFAVAPAAPPAWRAASLPLDPAGL